ncbi:MAG: NADH-quinone oxidoreductase subunit M, partial [Chloroflexi bacterium]|nr:NADH-quinone oxidoreductase subunit M [Chloroflexota bacterium]
MDQLGLPYLSIVVFLPLAGAIVVGLIPWQRVQAIRLTSAAFSLAALLLSIALYFGFDHSAQGPWFQQRAFWIPNIGVSFFLGVDGL